MANKTYRIAMPFTGVAFREVDAESEEEAIDKFYDEATFEDFERWEFCEDIVQGNVFYGIQNSMEIECEED